MPGIFYKPETKLSINESDNWSEKIMGFEHGTIADDLDIYEHNE